MKNKINVFTVEDHPLTRFGISQVVNQEEDMTICGEAGSLDEAIYKIDKNQPDIALIDISLENSNGFALIKYLKSMYKDIRILVITMHDDIFYLQQTFFVKADGYFYKRDHINNLPCAIRKIISGTLYYSEQIAPQIRLLLSIKPYHNSPLDKLTEREKEIFLLLAQGKSRDKIAEHLFIAVKTVNTHIENMKKKLGFSTFKELQKYAMDWWTNSI